MRWREERRLDRGRGSGREGERREGGGGVRKEERESGRERKVGVERDSGCNSQTAILQQVTMLTTQVSVCD